MKRALIIAAASLQVLVLVYMAWERESVLRNGRIVFLRTMPIDPRDPFRGDYVRLDYEMGHVSTNQVRGVTATQAGVRQGQRVYAILRDGPGGVARLDHVSGVAPDTGLFVRGRTDRSYGPFMNVRYGIEAYFVQQEKGRILEDGRRRGEVRVPLEMEVAVGRNGLAVLKGYRWCPLGMGLSFVTATNRQVRSVTVRLVNVSSNDLAVVDAPGGRSLTMEPDAFRAWNEPEWQWVGAQTPRPDLLDEDVRVLKPGESHEIRVDLESPEWFVSKPGDKPRGVGGLAWRAMFRLAYRSPSPEACRRLKHGSLIWQGELLSQAFGGGRVD
jgi:uncharacterized membrane-anchored protein